jgi:glycosylphosphatidylinositol transamidase (GPIT) subunit GPI8
MTDSTTTTQQTIKDVQNVEKGIDYTNPVSVSINIALIVIILYFAIVNNKLKKK